MRDLGLGVGPLAAHELHTVALQRGHVDRQPDTGLAPVEFAVLQSAFEEAHGSEDRHGIRHEIEVQLTGPDVILRVGQFLVVPHGDTSLT